MLKRKKRKNRKAPHVQSINQSEQNDERTTISGPREQALMNEGSTSVATCVGEGGKRKLHLRWTVPVTLNIHERT